jgi:hypothetical protein
MLLPVDLEIRRHFEKISILNYDYLENNKKIELYDFNMIFD